MFSFQPPTDPNMQPVPAELDPMMDPAMEGELLPPEEDVSEPAPRPIDWRVRRYWDDEQERHTLGRWLVEEIDRWYEAVSWRLDNLKQWRDDYEMMPAAADTPYEGAATVRAPFTAYACDNHATRLDAQIVQAEPVVIAEPMDEEAVDAAPEIEEATAGRLEEAEWACEAKSLHLDAAIVGNAWLRVEFEERVKRAPRLKFDQEESEYAGAVRALILAGADLGTAQMAALPRDKGGALRYALEWDEITEYAGTGFKFIPFEDGFLFPATCRDARHARGIGERFVISGLDLKQGAKSGLFIESEVEELLKKQGDEQPEGRQDRQDHAGLEVGSAQGPLGDHDALYRDYLCYRMSLRLDGDGDEKEEILLVTLHYDTRRILDIRYSKYQHGEHIYHLFPFKSRPGELLGYGVAEKIAVLQDAGTAVYCQAINHNDLAINSTLSFLHDDSAMLDLDSFEFMMGRPIKVRDVRGIKELPFVQLPVEALNLLQRIKDDVDLIAGTSNPSLGKATDTDRTAREVTIVASNSNMLFEGVAEGMALRWSRVWEQMRSIEAQFARDGQVRYRKSRYARAMAQSPEEMFGSLDAQAMMANVRLVPAGLRQLSDMQSRLSQAMAMDNVFKNNPLTANNPEVMRISLQAQMSAGRYEQREKVLLAVDRMLGQQARADQQQAMLTEQALGVPPEILQVLGQLPPEVLKSMMEQAQQAGATTGSAPAPEAPGAGQAPMPGAMGPEAALGSMPGMM